MHRPYSHRKCKSLCIFFVLFKKTEETFRTALIMNLARIDEYSPPKCIKNRCVDNHNFNKWQRFQYSHRIPSKNCTNFEPKSYSKCPWKIQKQFDLHFKRVLFSFAGLFWIKNQVRQKFVGEMASTLAVIHKHRRRKKAALIRIACQFFVKSSLLMALS